MAFNAINTRLIAESSPANRNFLTPAYDFESQNEVKSRMINSSKLNVNNLVRLTAAKYNQGTFSSSDTLIASLISVFNPPNKDQLVLGNPYISVYEGTAINEDYQIWVARGGSAVGTYAFKSGFDYQLRQIYINDYNYPANSLFFNVSIQNLAGTSSQAITVVYQLAYIDYVYDTKKRYA